MSKTIDQREEALLRQQEAERQKKRQEWRVIDFLGIKDESMRVVICTHDDSSGKTDTHFAAIISREPVGSLTHREAVALMREFIERGIVTDEIVEKWKNPGFSATWAPASCNYSRAGREAEMIGTAQVKLEVSGTARFCTRDLVFWAQMPGGDQEFIKIVMHLDSLPLGWESHPRFLGFDASNGHCKGVQVLTPAKLPGATVRTGLGQSDSWRVDHYWLTFDKFFQEYQAADHIGEGVWVRQ